MTWWHANWMGALIGLIAGTIIALVIVAWRTNLVIGVVTSTVAVAVSFWLCRHFPVHIFGRRTSMWLDRPVLPGEYAVRFICGFLVGGFFSFWCAARICKTLPTLIVVSVALAALCGLLAMALGDGFWTRD